MCKHLTAPAGTEFEGVVKLSNKMGLTVVHPMDGEPIRVMLPRDLQVKLNMDEFNKVKIGDKVNIKILKSKHSIGDNYLTSIGILA